VSTADALFIFYVFLFLPYLVLRGVQRLRATAISVPAGPRRHISTLLVHGVLLMLALVTVRADRIPLRFAPADPTRAAALGLMLFVVMWVWLVIRAKLPPSKDAVLRPEQIAPRDPQMWLMWVLTSSSAGIIEEIVYRGVGTVVLAQYVGGMVPAALLSAIAFGVSHATQGKRGMIVTGAFALGAQWLIAATGALGPAMAVHVAYDVAAGWMLAKQNPRRQAPSAAATA
jgi:membrane protease YdiL (CAAX protease family)